jgi:hypothetical protein
MTDEAYSEIVRNAEASNLVGPKLVWLAIGRYFNNPRGNLRNQALSDRRGGSAPCSIAVQKQDDFPEVLTQKFLLPRGESATHQCVVADSGRKFAIRKDLCP